KIDRYEKLCADRGQEPANVALAWLLHQKGVTAPIIGPRTLEQFTGALGAIDIELDDAALKELDEIFPGPGGRAPEAYAW
ncbi:MAG: aldo/keto reductase, partial [Acidimicrobiia bacterium]